MEGLQVWFDSLGTFLQVLYCVAIPATLIVLIQAVLLALGLTGAHEGIDLSDVSGLDGGGVGGMGDVGDVPQGINGGLHSGDGAGEFGTIGLFSVQGIMSFLCVFGWSGIALYGMGVPSVGAAVIALVLGFGAMYGVAALLRAFAKLVQDGTTRYGSFAGAAATVYLKIPAGGRGKISVNSDGRAVELDAAAETGELIETGANVEIVKMQGTAAVVRRSVSAVGGSIGSLPV